MLASAFNRKANQLQCHLTCMLSGVSGDLPNVHGRNVLITFMVATFSYQKPLFRREHSGNQHGLLLANNAVSRCSQANGAVSRRCNCPPTKRRGLSSLQKASFSAQATRSLVVAGGYFLTTRSLVVAFFLFKLYTTQDSCLLRPYCHCFSNCEQTFRRWRKTSTRSKTGIRRGIFHFGEVLAISVQQCLGLQGHRGFERFVRLLLCSDRP
jgi:hypothetical protein